MDNEMTNDEVIEILKSLEARRELIRIVRKDYWYTGNHIWTLIIFGCMLLLWFIAMIIWATFSSSEFSVHQAIFLVIILFPFMSYPLMSRISNLEKRLKALVELMEAEHFFEKDNKKNPTSAGNKADDE